MHQQQPLLQSNFQIPSDWEPVENHDGLYKAGNRHYLYLQGMNAPLLLSSNENISTRTAKGFLELLGHSKAFLFTTIVMTLIFVARIKESTNADGLTSKEQLDFIKFIINNSTSNTSTIARSNHYLNNLSSGVTITTGFFEQITLAMCIGGWAATTLKVFPALSDSLPNITKSHSALSISSVIAFASYLICTAFTLSTTISSDDNKLYSFMNHLSPEFRPLGFLLMSILAGAASTFLFKQVDESANENAASSAREIASEWAANAASAIRQNWAHTTAFFTASTPEAQYAKLAPVYRQQQQAPSDDQSLDPINSNGYNRSH